MSQALSNWKGNSQNGYVDEYQNIQTFWLDPGFQKSSRLLSKNWITTEGLVHNWGNKNPQKSGKQSILVGSMDTSRIDDAGAIRPAPHAPLMLSQRMGMAPKVKPMLADQEHNICGRLELCNNGGSEHHTLGFACPGNHG